ncbi:unnamed protein product, partial [Polarella glacialis]
SENSESKPEGPGRASRASTIDWLLRELRPVSYKFRDGPEAKHARYGFVAQELEKIMPDMVRTHKANKHVMYEDLVAILTLASQVQQGRLEQLEARAKQRSDRLKDQAGLLKRLSRAVSGLTARISRWESLADPLRRDSRRSR